jgi:hypothetical protein
LASDFQKSEGSLRFSCMRFSHGPSTFRHLSCSAAELATFLLVTGLRWAVGLGENKVPLNPLVNHNFPYQMVTLWVYLDGIYSRYSRCPKFSASHAVGLCMLCT